MSSDNDGLVRLHCHWPTRPLEGLFVNMAVGQNSAIDEIANWSDDLPPVGVLLAARIGAFDGDGEGVVSRFAAGHFNSRDYSNGIAVSSRGGLVSLGRRLE